MTGVFLQGLGSLTRQYARMARIRRSGYPGTGTGGSGNRISGTCGLIRTPVNAAPVRVSTMIRRESTCQPVVPAAAAGSAMVGIMQADGTMKMEPRLGVTKTIDASSGYGLNRKGTSA